MDRKRPRAEIRRAGASLWQSKQKSRSVRQQPAEEVRDGRRHREPVIGKEVVRGVGEFLEQRSSRLPDGPGQRLPAQQRAIS